MKKIQTFEDACKALDLSTTIPDVSLLSEKHQNAIIAHYKLVIIAQALNEVWEPNWDDNNECKYYPWFRLSGSGLSDSTCYYSATGAGADVGARLCFKTKELALYAGKQFEELYKDYLILS